MQEQKGVKRREEGMINGRHDQPPCRPMLGPTVCRFRGLAEYEWLHDRLQCNNLNIMS